MGTIGITHLYAHVPFCRSRCAYCDFEAEPVGPHARAGRVDEYLRALRAELESLRHGVESVDGALLQLRPPLETVYLGGGTPTVLPTDPLVDLVADLASLGPAFAPVRSTAPWEFTIEANPGTIDTIMLERLMKAGVTRLSLGVQSFSPALRAALGRRVTQREIDEALEAISAVGWVDWNLDLVFGIPGQTWDDAIADIEAALAAGPTHVSLYDLTYTAAFAGRVDARGGAGARAAAARFAEEHYDPAIQRLQNGGYRRYEVSNFAVPGHECRHNLAYWRGEDYLGAGAAAVSTAGGSRRTAPRTIEAYLSDGPAEIERVSPTVRLWEKAMLGLRTSEGIDETEVFPVLDPAARERLLRQGCVERHCGRLRLNPGFLDVSNSVIATLLVPPEDP